jgi:hypothetical protein
MSRKMFAFFLLPAGLLVASASASAQDETEVYEEEGVEDEAEAVVFVEPPPQENFQLQASSRERVDGPRFRGGVAFTAGVQGLPQHDYTATMFGVDARFGVQINNLIGIYAMPHLSFGSSGSLFSSTGTFNAIVMADVTLFDALVAGAGLGYGVFNNPSGPMVAFRVGGYPLKSVSEDRPRRKGLMISLETRLTFIGDHNGFPYGTGYQVMGAVGYEAF